MTAPRLRLLCRVVDNFGDAGVCWRLARQLAAEFGWQVRLVIDRPELLVRLGGAEQAGPAQFAPAQSDPAQSDPAQAGSRRAGDAPGDMPAQAATQPGPPTGSLTVERWPDDHPAHAPTDDSTVAVAAAQTRTDPTAPPDDILISAFGALPPPPLRARLAGAPRRPLWVNLEYLSAEDWVDDCHGLHSIKPADGAREHFYYPGFTERSGGLLRERGLIERRDAFVGSAAQARWLAAHGIARRDARERLITLFCYADAPVAPWLAQLAADARPSTVLVPESVADAALADFLGTAPAIGERIERGALRVQRLPFLPQDDYDRLLWSADLNFVRGEDSWIRAHWAGRPFVWQPYRQDDGAHRHKLQAFLQRLAAGPAAERMMLAWSAGQADAWADFDAQLPALAARFCAWSQQLAAQPDLATRLAAFCAERL